ncbi:aKG-HExxH-type peptide beta-hydroxylase [Pseudomonas sp. NPDC087358]|uniref:aKG-HExxH-type peptide beta-hydroxylase n=1 Tax=Pseudomonas sp. NPDC087358 TaxID=3364439 RepID=UPI003850B3C3
MDARAFFEIIGGLPFITDGSRPATLLTAVACSRRNAAPDAHEALIDYLDPENARVLFKRLARSQVDEFDSTFCSALEQQEIAAATVRIGRVAEAWRSFFAIPIRYRKLVQPMSSSTSALIPQTIYLGQRAFESHIPLEETLVHEHAHIWLNFVMEAYDLQTEDAPRDYVLPSGTSGKTLRGVMAAAHFAAVALKFYRSQNNNLPSTARQAYLHKYLAGCLDIAAQRPCFTPMGSLVARALNDFYQDITICPEGIPS